jgi:hypothetical protein
MAMMELYGKGVYLDAGKPVLAEKYRGAVKTPDEGREKTVAYKILGRTTRGRTPNGCA